jgi:hypothetical protein
VRVRQVEEMKHEEACDARENVTKVKQVKEVNQVKHVHVKRASIELCAHTLPGARCRDTPVWP